MAIRAAAGDHAFQDYQPAPYGRGRAPGTGRGPIASPSRSITSREEFDATVRQLGEIVIRAGEVRVANRAAANGDGGGQPYRATDRIVALASALQNRELRGRFWPPINDTGCPPTIVPGRWLEPSAVEDAVRAMRHNRCPASLAMRVDGVALGTGKVLAGAMISARQRHHRSQGTAHLKLIEPRSGQWSSPLGRSPFSARSRATETGAVGGLPLRGSGNRRGWAGSGFLARPRASCSCSAPPIMPAATANACGGGGGGGGRALGLDLPTCDRSDPRLDCSNRPTLDNSFYKYRRI